MPKGWGGARDGAGQKNRSGVDWSDPAAVAEYKRRYREVHEPPTGEKPESGTPKTVIVNSVAYATLADAARALGISKQRMSQIVKRDGYDIER